MAMITEISDIQKKYCSRAMLVCLGVAGILIVFGAKPMAKGLILGTIFSIINFVLMGLMLPSRINKARKKTFWVGLGSIWFRYIILALPLIIAFYSESFDFFTAAAGLFMIQFTILAHHLGGVVFGLTPNQ